MKRTHSCNALRGADQGKDVTLCGWVRRRRALGNLIFVDLRDREGITQIVFDPAAGAYYGLGEKETGAFTHKTL